MINDIESGTGFKVGADESNVAVIKFVSNHRDVAVAKDEMGNATDNHNTHKETNWKDGGNASIRIVWEEVVPFVEDIT